MSEEQDILQELGIEEINEDTQTIIQLWYMANQEPERRL